MATLSKLWIVITSSSIVISLSAHILGTQSKGQHTEVNFETLASYLQSTQRNTYHYTYSIYRLVLTCDILVLGITLSVIIASESRRTKLFEVENYA